MKKLREVVKNEQENGMADRKSETKNILPCQYGCEVILENTSIESAKDSSFPNDAYLIWYIVDSQEQVDLVRGTRVRIFDMYYDKYGPNSIKKIDFGYGRTNPKLWGYQKNEKKKRK